MERIRNVGPQGGPRPPEQKPPPFSLVTVTYPDDYKEEDDEFIAQSVVSQPPFVIIAGLQGNPMNRRFIRADVIESIKQEHLPEEELGLTTEEG